MQVIAGTAKGRRLVAPPGLDTRPLTSRVKASLFDILQPDLAGARVLDLFAGSGQLGIEALSRGAEHATFVELGGKAVRSVRRNLDATGLRDRATVVRTDVLAFLARGDTKPYDLVLVAPPQYQGLVPRTLDALDRSPCLSLDGIVVAQQSNTEPLPGDLPALERVDLRGYGSTLLLFYRRRE